MTLSLHPFGVGILLGSASFWGQDDFGSASFWGGDPYGSVDIHKEKVSRREIGALTVTRRCLSFQKVLAPPEPPVLEPYYRRPLNFSALDGVGHGVKDTSTQLSRTGTLARKSTKSSSAQAAGTLG
ncbi:ABI gene family member 3-like, partial [Geospiza fortis]|uniref:ABI gene family member 3-like n=1 Tax=Geospiza fortis TaxID=48883 RepID=A0A8N5I561_GEOFO